jgi:hypothetical protein
MNNKSKRASNRSAAIINLGKERKEKIRRFRAKEELSGNKITSIEEAVNILVDRALETETLQS